MTLKEFSFEFDILYNSIMSNIAPSLNEYEKSIFLTQAQEALVTEMYHSYESTEGATELLKELVTTIKPSLSNFTTITPNGAITYDLPKDVMFIVFEEVKLDNKKKSCEGSLTTGTVYPTTHDYLHTILKNPFRGPKGNKVVRLLHQDKIELYSGLEIKDYTIRYIKRPKPIILVDLDDYIEDLDGQYEGLHIGEDINGNPYIKKQECELNPALHRSILQRAVMLAQYSWKSGT